jgi:NAD(P)H-nitrite reductase large subunit
VGFSTYDLSHTRKDYHVRDWENASDDETVCYCMAIKKAAIVEAVKSGCDTLEKLKNATTACTGGRCKELNPSGQCCANDLRQLIGIYSKGS